MVPGCGGNGDGIAVWFRRGLTIGRHVRSGPDFEWRTTDDMIDSSSGSITINIEATGVRDLGIDLRPLEGRPGCHFSRWRLDPLFVE